MFAVIESGSKQFLVTPGTVVISEKLNTEVGSNLAFAKVIALGSDGSLRPGDPSAVTASVLSCAKTKKIIVFKKRRRHNFRRKQGHRQHITVLRVTEVRSV